MPLPGSRLRAIASRVFNAKTMERVIDPSVADLQREGGSVAGYMALVKVIARCITGGGMVEPASWPADDRRFIAKALLWSALFIAVLTALLDRPSRYAMPQVLRTSSALPPLYLAPAALSTAFTIGAALGLMVALRGREITSRIVVTVLALALALSVFSFVNLGWVAPSANREFAVLVSGQPVPDIGEMTLGELARTIDQFSDPVFASFGYLRALQYNYHGRMALAWSPVVFAILVVSIAAALRRRWVLVLAACGAWYFFVGAPELRPWNSGLSPFVAAWSGNLLVLCISAVVYVNARLRSRVSLPA